ncbi:cytochrome aa3 quinol oxidase subunit II [Anoxybacillus rupiensis]|jgi:cytochrome aa3-600 menaquinol oxidase subunit II|uniref:Quinol oxidase subunit 2 n=1 Tax=Anoxybacteroides rupiense TaxID=311460 RepID=A0ABD5IXY4_9BACL|nr:MULTISPECIES: cytochrome aa3 quinol oxidase subunit II [Anoxybacillus]MBB3908229.1 cytochrome aa3-600 menaquinol oxidase subunit 2 [Anoxybacillus rupiensis]MBS2772358.1 cytochrome aa3 quinol oxidase subunit II [Anoxybacillus rupiensis]MDE8563954.1 cytochrome aa3 quinol oxidase subunit II [Anoxybacillus rupiensis]MED5052489.1 cytochrome aa3 quinol oxidase subunit II [Anoxybacillus rupiensis]OQM44486.1 cytochrome aa3 quinol oxidase subunit II [Anoxybacillus sp. UARK-01]
MKQKIWKWASLLPLSLVLLLSGCSENMLVMRPKGPVAKTQYDLILWSIGFMLLIIVVVFVLFTVVLIRYREKPGMENYEPEEEGNTLLEIVWTAIPILIVTALAIPTVKATFALEKPTKEKVEPITIHVTAANWKWIFSYPDQNIETVNYVNIPVDVPVKFKLTSVGPMNSFWVPQLGGQKYAMDGMETELFLEADEPGSYMGRSANFSGEGFTHMEFEVVAQTQKEFNKWVKEAQSTAPKLSETKYETILKPGLVGRMTFSNTHLEWIDHSKQNSHHAGEADEQARLCNPLEGNGIVVE